MFAEGSQVEEGRLARPKSRGNRPNKANSPLKHITDIDGRTRARKMAETLFRALLSDLGGEENVSAARRALAEHAAVLNAVACDAGARYLSGEPIDTAEFATVTNALRRLLADIGLERVARDVTNLSSYLAARSAAEPVTKPDVAKPDVTELGR